MKSETEQFPFVVADAAQGEASLLPFIPITLSLREQSVSVPGLLDTGSAVNVLPHHVGLQLGAVWEEQTTSVRLTGALVNESARVLIVQATVGKFAPVRLAFAWTQSNSHPVILGQVNFFMEFDACFFRSRSLFEIKRKSVQA